MAVRSSGRLTFSEIASEFGDSAPHSMSEFVRGGSRVPNAAPNSNIPTAINSGRMRFFHFYGAVNVIAYTASSGTYLNAATAFGSSWGDSVPKELIIPSGVTIGSSSTGTAALILPTGMAGTLTIKNSGSIEGAGGAAGSNGGDAILVQSSGVSIENAGVIYAGGGGGGTGGNGSYTTTQSLGGGQNNNNSGNHGTRCNYSCTDIYGGGAYCGSCTAVSDETSRCNACYRNVTGTSSGGAGGVGQGYAQSARPGAAGGTNAGTGGTGGSFGSSGNAGANGNASSGSAGGLAGYYVNGIGNVTFTTTGTVAGRTA